MRVISLRAENFKRLQAVEIHPDGAVIEVRGRNGQGKSSLLDSICAALGGADVAPKKPIREGADRAEIVVDADKARAIERANLPVPGLGFGDGEVLFGGVPFEQASQAEKIRVSVAIAMAANPSLKVLCIRDGSLLDRDSLRLLTEIVEQNDYQLWLEKVGDEDAATGIVIEDGTVRGAALVAEAAE